MKISEMIAELSNIKSEYGDIDVYFQNDPHPAKEVSSYESFYILPEEYLPDEDHVEKYTIVNLRTWLY